jgi:hypothetical protein
MGNIAKSVTTPANAPVFITLSLHFHVFHSKQKRWTHTHTYTHTMCVCVYYIERGREGGRQEVREAGREREGDRVNIHIYI